MSTQPTPYPQFPQLSRGMDPLAGDETPLDPTLRDNYENGMESTRARYTRVRRTFTVAYRYITFDDKALLDAFYQNTVSFGAGIFIFTDTADLENPVSYTVRFASLPKYTRAGFIQDDDGGNQRVHVQFQIREV